MSDNPYFTDVQTAVAAAYDAFGRGRVSAALEVCLCPVCMTEETRQQIIATPNDALSVALVQEYSNSAHGVPDNLDDLRLLLPRYLEIIAEDELVDHVGVGTELLRFGHARAAHPDLYSPQQSEVLRDWARAVIWYFAWADTTEEGALYTPAALLEMLLCGGWEFDGLTQTLEAVFAETTIGEQSLCSFAGAVMRRAKTRQGKIAPDWFAMRHCSAETRMALVAWLNALAGSDRALALATDPGGADTYNTVQSFVWAAGTFDAALWPAPD